MSDEIGKMISVGSERYQGVWKKKLKNGDIAFYVNFKNEKGIATKKKVGTKSKNSNYTVQNAFSELQKIKAEVKQNRENEIYDSNDKKKITLNQLWEHYWSGEASLNDGAENIRLNYESQIKPEFGHRKIVSLKLKEFEDFRDKKLQEIVKIIKIDEKEKNIKKSSTTVKHYLTLAKAIFNFAIKRELVHSSFKNPLANIKMPDVKNNSRLAYLTHTEVDHILEYLKEKHYLTYQLVVLMIGTGARFSEITGGSAQKQKLNVERGLFWRNINFEQNTIFFDATKNGNPRFVYMNELVRTVIDELYTNKTSNRVITNSANGIILKMPKYFQDAVNQVRPSNQEADTRDKIVAHSLRHTHASWLAEKGLDIFHIKEQLGHKDIKSTMRYAHFSPVKRHDATKVLFEKPELKEKT